MADPIPQHKLVIVQESMLDGMSNNAAYVKEFPFLKGLALMPKPKCGSCGGGTANAARQLSYAAAKRTLASMPADKKRKLKELLNTKHVRIVFKHENGKAVELTF